MVLLDGSQYKWGVIRAEEYKYRAGEQTGMSGEDGSKKRLNNTAREQIASVTISGSSIETKPGRDPDELSDGE